MLGKTNVVDKKYCCVASNSLKVACFVDGSSPPRLVYYLTDVGLEFPGEYTHVIQLNPSKSARNTYYTKN